MASTYSHKWSRPLINYIALPRIKGLTSLFWLGNLLERPSYQQSILKFETHSRCQSKVPTLTIFLRPHNQKPKYQSYLSKFHLVALGTYNALSHNWRRELISFYLINEKHQGQLILQSVNLSWRVYFEVWCLGARCSLNVNIQDLIGFISMFLLMCILIFVVK